MQFKHTKMRNKYYRLYRDILDAFVINYRYEIHKPDQTIRLFHGTHTSHLESILKHGLLPSIQTRNNNWSKITDGSHPALVYVTDKWHYFFSSNTAPRAAGFPCYIEFDVPKELLLADDDYFVSAHFSRLAKREEAEGKSGTEVIAKHGSPQNSLEHCGVAAIIGRLPAEFIRSFTIIADRDWLKRHIIQDSSPYEKERKAWTNGFGKGRMTHQDMLRFEQDSDFIKKWTVSSNGEVIGEWKAWVKDLLNVESEMRHAQ